MGRPQRTWRDGAVALLLALAAPLWAGDAPPAVIRDFSKGLQTTLDSAMIDDGASPDLVNVDVENGSIEKRGGSVAVSSSSLGGYSLPVRFLYEYIEPDGDRWIISASSATIFKSNNGGQNNTVLTSTHGFTSSSDYCAVTAFGTMRLTDGTTNWITFNGSTLGVSTSAPKGLTCAFFGDRLWTSIGSTLYATSTEDVEDWTVNTSSGDADAIEQDVRFNDGQGISCLRAFRDRLLIFKAQSMDAYVRNEDGLTYRLEGISNNIGTSHCNSVVEREGDVVFLGPDAFYKYDPGTAAYKGYSGSLTRISDLIQPTVRDIQQLDSNSTFHIETGQSDFDAGTLVQMNSSITPGSLVLSTWTATDDSTSDFQAFTSSSNVNITNGRVHLSTSNTDVYNYDLSIGPATGWDISAGFGLTGTTLFSSCAVGNWRVIRTAGGSDTTVNVKILDAAGNLLETIPVTSTSTTGPEDKTFSTSAYVGRWIKVQFDESPNGDYIRTTDPFLSSGNTMTFGTYLASGRRIIGCFRNGRSTIYSGTIAGQSRDTSFPTPLWLASTPTYSTNGHSISFQTESSTNGSSWDSPVSWTPGSAPASASKQRIRWSVTISTGGTTGGTALPFVEAVPLAARSSTGTYQGSHFATSVTALGTFTGLHTLNGGAVGYAVFTDTNTSATFSNSSTWISSQAVTNGQVPTISPSTYAFFVASETITSATNDPTINEVSLALTGGNQVPVWSDYHRGSYVTALSTFSTSGNDSVLIYDRNSAWTFYDHDWYCVRRILSGSVLAGSASDGKIYRWRDESLANDNGSSISWSWRSKDFDFGLPLTNKAMLRYYVTADYALSSDATFSYGVNRGSSASATLDLDLYSGFFRKSIAPASLTYSNGIQHFFRISGSGVDESCVIRSVVMKVRSETDP